MCDKSSGVREEEGKCKGLRQAQSQESLQRHLKNKQGLGEGGVTGA